MLENPGVSRERDPQESPQVGSQGNFIVEFPAFDQEVLESCDLQIGHGLIRSTIALAEPDANRLCSREYVAHQGYLADFLRFVGLLDADCVNPQRDGTIVIAVVVLFLGVPYAV